MGDGSVPADGETADGSTADGTDREHGSGAVAVDPRGDVVLDTTFHTSPETLRKARRAALAASRRAGPSAPPPPDLKAQVRVAYRVSLECLRGQSGYFARLLSDTQFGEARLVADAHSELARGGLDPATAHAGQLPWVAISDDDEATRAAGRERVFEDMLRILHRQPPATARPTMSYVTTLVLTADRFDCVAAVSRCASTALKFKWPVTTGRPMRDDAGRPTDVEQVLRQKVLVSWLLNQPMRLHNSTRELILRGSRRWSLFEDANADADDGTTTAAAWWTLPDGLEGEQPRTHPAAAAAAPWAGIPIPPLLTRHSRRTPAPPRAHPQHHCLGPAPLCRAVLVARAPVQAGLRLERRLRLVPAGPAAQVPRRQGPRLPRRLQPRLCRRRPGHVGRRH